MIEYKKIIKTSPVPFIGQKRNVIKHLYEYFKNIDFDEDVIIIDLFGGSGLLANLFKRMYPSNRVIWNDFDNMQEVYKNIDELNECKDKINKLLDKNNIRLKKYIPEDIMQEVYKIIQEIDNAYMKAILLKGVCTGFNMNPAQNDGKGYRTLKQNPYIIGDFLEDVERVSCDFIELIEAYKNKKTFWILDPPYINTDCKAYKAELSMEQISYLIEFLKDTENKHVFFTSDRSQFYILYTMLLYKQPDIALSKNDVMYKDKKELTFINL